MVTALKFFCKHFGTKQPFIFSGFVKYLLKRRPSVQQWSICKLALYALQHFLSFYRMDHILI